jgi:hypothetical protein
VLLSRKSHTYGCTFSKATVCNSPCISFIWFCNVCKSKNKQQSACARTRLNCGVASGARCAHMCMQARICTFSDTYISTEGGQDHHLPRRWNYYGIGIVASHRVCMCACLRTVGSDRTYVYMCACARSGARNDLPANRRTVSAACEPHRSDAASPGFAAAAATAGFPA